MFKKLFYYLIIFDILLVVLHIVWGDKVYVLNLDYERTIPAYYSGLKLMGVGFTAFLIFLLSRAFKERALWFLIAFFFFFLALDEVSELHENLGDYLLKIFNDYSFFQQNSFMWLVFLAPIIILCLALLIYFIFYLRSEKSFPYLLLALASFFLVLVFEFWGGLIIKSQAQLYQVLIILEEFMEKLGASLFLASFLYLFRGKFEKIYQRRQDLLFKD